MRIAARACALLMVAGIALTARFLYAETIAQRNTIASLQRATELVRFAPAAEYFERLAVLDPDHSGQWLDAALSANPRLSQAWIAKGLDAESHGAAKEAEADLLKAASVDRQYLPAWTLTNFYFRQNRPAEFWLWARRAAQLTYDDFKPLLALAHTVEPDPETVISKLGAGQSLIEADVDYLATRGQLDHAQRAARILLARKNPAETPRLMELAKRQIRAGHARYALELWNALDHGDDPRLAPDARASANGDFTTEPSGAAFDWQLHHNPGFSVTWNHGELVVRLSGDQPESCVLIEQIVAIEAGRPYRLSYEYATTGLTLPTGLAWKLDGAAEVAIPPAPAWVTNSMQIQSSAGSTTKTQIGFGEPVLSRIRLLYSREPGTTRAQGEMQLRHFQLEAL